MSIPKRLGVGFIGSGFITRFHLQSWSSIRDADVLGIWSPNPAHAQEASEYGYENENRCFTRCFLEGRQPELNFHDGLEVVELLMAAYLSAEQGRTLDWKPAGLASFIPAVAQGTWKP